MIYNKFNTLQAAQEAQNNDFLALKAKRYAESSNHKELDAHYKVTIAWAEVRETIDGFFVYPKCLEIETNYETLGNPIFFQTNESDNI